MSSSILIDIASGDSSGMSRCLDRYSGLIWSLARRHCPTPEDAEDAVQEVFLEVWRNADRFDPDIASETTFVAMIARRRLIDRARRAKRQLKAEALPDHDALAGQDEPDRVAISDEATKVSNALATLRPEQQRVLELSLVHGKSHSQISEQTGMPLGTVKSLARRGLIKVREQLGVAPPEGGSQ